MKRKFLAMTMTGMLAISMLVGCGGKDPETATVSTEVSTQKEVTSNEVTAEKSVTMIQNTANELATSIGEIQTAKNHSFEKMVLTYQNESVTITEKSISDHKTNKKLTVTKTEKKKEFFDAQGVPQVSLTFKEVTKSAQPLKMEVTWKNKDGADTTKSATVNIHVVPESLKVVKPLTENQKISETVKKYDFDVYAKNVAEKAKDTVESASVKKSNVQFGKPGHYEVIYEVVLKPDSNKHDVTVDVEIVDKEQAEQSDDVITENVKPGDNPTAKPENNKPNKEDNNSSDKNDKPSKEEKPSNKPNNNSSSNNNGSSNNNKPSKPNNNGGSSNNKPSKPQHSHNYSASVTKQPTCSSAGTKTYTCSCGASYSESIPALSHNWHHHDATGHYDKVVDQPAWDEPIYETRVVCNGCGAQFTSTQEAGEHIMSTDCPNYRVDDVQTGTIHHEATYKDVWVQDSAAYDECTNCGARK